MWRTSQPISVQTWYPKQYCNPDNGRFMCPSSQHKVALVIVASNSLKRSSGRGSGTMMSCFMAVDGRWICIKKRSVFYNKIIWCCYFLRFITVYWKGKLFKKMRQMITNLSDLNDWLVWADARFGDFKLNIPITRKYAFRCSFSRQQPSTRLSNTIHPTNSTKCYFNGVIVNNEL